MLDSRCMHLAKQSGAGLWTLILGLAVCLFVQLWSARMNAVPLNIPFSFSIGPTQTSEFKTLAAIPYDVQIAFDTTRLPLKELNCLIGTNIPSVEPCSGQTPILNMEWKLTSNNQILARGSSTEAARAAYSYHRATRYLGRFDSQAGRKYRLDLDVLQDATRLAKADPRLEVVPFLDAYEGRLLLASLAFLLGSVGASAGLFIILKSTLHKRRSPQ